MKRLAAFLILLTIPLAGCGKKAEFPVPEGIQVVRAVLQPVPFSLKRRGTYALIAPDGQMAAYAESTAVNLHALEGREVQLEGIFEKNIDPSMLPVFVVQKVLEGGTENTRPWSIPVLGLTVQLPRSWQGKLSGQSATFTASGYTLPILKITGIVQKGSGISPNPSYGALPIPSPALSSSAGGELLVVGLRKAIATLSSDGTSWTVSVTAPAQEVDFVFTIRPEIPADQQLTIYKAILRTVEFPFAGGNGVASSRASASSVHGGTSSAGSAGSSQSRAAGEGAPCGGPAGILCPSGTYCRIIDAKTVSGVCAHR